MQWEYNTYVMTATDKRSAWNEPLIDSRHEVEDGGRNKEVTTRHPPSTNGRDEQQNSS